MFYSLEDRVTTGFHSLVSIFETVKESPTTCCTPGAAHAHHLPHRSPGPQVAASPTASWRRRPGPGRWWCQPWPPRRRYLGFHGAWWGGGPAPNGAAGVRRSIRKQGVREDGEVPCSQIAAFLTNTKGLFSSLDEATRWKNISGSINGLTRRQLSEPETDRQM